MHFLSLENCKAAEKRISLASVSKGQRVSVWGCQDHSFVPAFTGRDPLALGAYSYGVLRQGYAIAYDNSVSRSYVKIVGRSKKEKTKNCIEQVSRIYSEGLF